MNPVDTKISNDLSDFKRIFAQHTEDDKRAFAKNDQNHIENTARMEKMIKMVEELSLRVEPVVKFFNNITFTNGAVMWFLKGIAAFGVAIGFVVAFILWLKNH